MKFEIKKSLVHAMWYRNRLVKIERLSITQTTLTIVVEGASKMEETEVF